MTSEVQVFGLKNVAIDRLKLPGDWRAILDSESAMEQGESIARVGLIQNPVVRKSDKLLICGAHRVAGIVLQGGKLVTVKLVECSDEQASDMKTEENMARKHPQKDKRPPRAAKTAGRKKLAKELGIHLESVRQSEWRERKRIQERELEKRPIHLRGMELDTDYLVLVRMTQRHMETAAKKLRGAAGHFTRMVQQGCPLPQALSQDYVEPARTKAAQLLSEIPWSLCPYCRAVGGVVEDCEYCHCTGWLAEKNMKDVPPELMDDENPAVLYRGEIITVEKYLGEEEVPGNDVDLDDEGDLADLWK